ncbi:hypothetical protein [Lacinutrix sp. Hel_I_90]|uniref:hypothetical protein n=1 Tax=Lacinutrix sp. Hel_I_90 TaxID=1249999 RepID=UPI0005CB1078|nr:hypothetical protein [Lacinutrix sp. Hel_I_90]
MNTQSDLKPLPEMPTKAKIHEIYKHCKKNWLIKRINEIIAASGGNIRDRILTKNQFKELIDDIGMPEGYKPFEN